MTTPAQVPLAVTGEMVAAAWIASVPGFTTAMTGPSLPPDVGPDGKAAPWVATGFVTVTTVGGSPRPLIPVHEPVMQVDCWTTAPGSNRPPWQMAEALGQAITRATWGRRTISRVLRPVVNGVAYPPASVQGAQVLTEWRRGYSDAADYALVTADLWLSWIQLDLTIP